jgi:hypothetical protein
MYCLILILGGLLIMIGQQFHRIRYYGFLVNRHRQQKLALGRRLLGMEPREETAATDRAEQDYRDRYEASYRFLALGMPRMSRRTDDRDRGDGSCALLAFTDTS